MKFSDDELYLGLNEQALYTSTEDYLNIFHHLGIHEGDSIADIGGGDGRGKLLFDQNYPNSHYYCLEKVSDRFSPSVNKAQEMGLDVSRYLPFDLKTQSLPKCEYYFFYFPFAPWIYSLFEQIISFKGNLIIIESHGDFVDKFERSYSYCFKQTKKIKLYSQRHRPYAYFYEYDLKQMSDEQYQIRKIRESDVIEVRQQDILLGEITWVHPVDDWALGDKEGEYQSLSSGRCYKKEEVIRARFFYPHEREYLLALRSRPEFRRLIISPETLIENSKGYRVRSSFYDGFDPLEYHSNYSDE